MRSSIKRLFLILIGALLIQTVLFGATFHAILVINTEDEGIGCIHDYNHWQSELPKIERATGMDIQQYIHMDDDWSAESVIETCEDLVAGPDDVILFYFSGHGLRLDETEAQWPVLAMQYDYGLELDWVHKRLSTKNARLLITMADCCNSYLDDFYVVSPPLRSYSRAVDAHYTSLFLESEGEIITSGCIPGQYSYGGSNGGVFTNQFLEALHDSTNTDWDDLMAEATLPIYKGEQLPQHSTEVSQTSGVAIVEEVEEEEEEEYEYEWEIEDNEEEESVTEWETDTYPAGLIFFYDGYEGEIEHSGDGSWVELNYNTGELDYFQQYDEDSYFYYLTTNSDYDFCKAIPKTGGIVYNSYGGDWEESESISGAIY